MHPSLAAIAAANGGAFSRRDALDAGYSAEEIRRHVADGRWVPLRRGTYVEAIAGEPALAVRAAAALVAMATGSAISHRTAAELIGFPSVGPRDALVHVTSPPGRSRRRNGIWSHAARLRPIDVVDQAGVRVTSPARTVVDVARTHGFRAGVACADAALASGTSEAELRDALEYLGDVNGRPRAQRVLAFADRAAESPGESLSRIAIHAAGLPRPQLQHEVRDGGELVGRVDFWWPAWRVVGEFDGRTKYVHRDDLWAEKRREDRLRAMGLAVVRWVWADVVGDFMPVARRLVEAGRRAAA